MPTVFVIGRDWKFRTAVRAELRERGIEALGMESAEDAAQAAVGTTPDAMVWDTTEDPPRSSPQDEHSAAGLALLARHAPLVVIASRMDPGAAPANAAAVLHRPVRVGEVVDRVLGLLAGQAA
jgi:hypothetical protein